MGLRKHGWLGQGGNDTQLTRADLCVFCTKQENVTNRTLTLIESEDNTRSW
jgi:soluble P-type ATPase